MKNKYICKKCGNHPRGGIRGAQSWDYDLCHRCFNQMPLTEALKYQQSDLGVTEHDLKFLEPIVKLKWTPVDSYWHELTVRYLMQNNYEV